MFVSLQAQIPDFTPQTPLIGALLHNDAGEAGRLLRQGADPNEGRFGGLPPVILAAARQDLELVRLMVARGADPNARDRSGSTALMWGAFNDSGDAAMVEALIALGADPLASNKAGETALSWALRRGETAAVATLRKAGASDNGKMRSSAQKALALLQQSGAQFSNTSRCSSCHHQSLPQMAFGIARTRGLEIDEALVQKQVDGAICAAEICGRGSAGEPRSNSRPAHRRQLRTPWIRRQRASARRSGRRDGGSRFRVAGR